MRPNGNLWLPNQGTFPRLNQNLGSYLTDGIDVTLNYNYPIDQWGGLNFTFLGTWVNQFVVEPIPGLGTYDCAGLYGPNCNPGGGAAVVPEWKSKALLVWNTPWNFNAALAWRYIGSVDLTYASSNPLLSDVYGSSDAHDRRAELLRPGAAVERDQELHDPGRRQQHLRPGSAARVVHGQPGCLSARSSTRRLAATATRTRGSTTRSDGFLFVTVTGKF